MQDFSREGRDVEERQKALQLYHETVQPFIEIKQQVINLSICGYILEDGILIRKFSPEILKVINGINDLILHHQEMILGEFLNERF